MTFHTAIYYRLMGYYETLQFVGNKCFIDNNHFSNYHNYRLSSIDRQWYMDTMLESYELEKDIDNE